jgi:hypothetical protein
LFPKGAKNRPCLKITCGRIRRRLDEGCVNVDSMGTLEWAAIQAQSLDPPNFKRENNLCSTLQNDPLWSAGQQP